MNHSNDFVLQKDIGTYTLVKQELCNFSLKTARLDFVLHVAAEANA